MPTLTSPAWQQKLHEHAHQCYYCGAIRFDLIQEHKTPRSRGGSNDPTNIVPACRECNMSKSDLTEQEFLEYRRGGIRPRQVVPIPKMIPKSAVISQTEAAQLLGVSRARVGQMVDAGILPAVEVQVMVRKVRRSDVDAIKDQDRRPGWRKQPKGAADADA